jgi:hypothetical protein
MKAQTLRYLGGYRLRHSARRGRRCKIRGMPSSLRGLRRCVAALLAALLPVASALATPPPLGELEGHYEYREGATLFMVADGDRLVAILGDGKYPLRATGVDTFMNGVGDTIPFIRDGAGWIVAFKEKGETFKRLSPDVPDTERSRLRPRRDTSIRSFLRPTILHPGTFPCRHSFRTDSSQS